MTYTQRVKELQLQQEQKAQTQWFQEQLVVLADTEQLNNGIRNQRQDTRILNREHT